MNGASFFFLAMYIHIARGLNFGSFNYPRIHVWLSGIMIFYLGIATAFCGYITMGANELLGCNCDYKFINSFTKWEQLVVWVWGGSTISGPTLSRFFTLHFLLH